MTNFEQMIDVDKYQVFLFTCPANIPLNFASHPWFVVNNKGKISRWEVLCDKNQCDSSWSHLHLNMRHHFHGIEMFPFGKNKLWKPKLKGFVEGVSGSYAQEMVEFIEKSHDTYPHCHTYRLPVLNSNTYAQWILNHFPEFKGKLPFGSFGKRYANKRLKIKGIEARPSS